MNPFWARGARDPQGTVRVDVHVDLVNELAIGAILLLCEFEAAGVAQRKGAPEQFVVPTLAPKRSGGGAAVGADFLDVV